MASPKQKLLETKPFFFSFSLKNRSCKAKHILPALADPAAAGDPAYPVPCAATNSSYLRNKTSSYL